jgi:hypothetical protein
MLDSERGKLLVVKVNFQHCESFFDFRRGGVKGKEGAMPRLELQAGYEATRR